MKTAAMTFFGFPGKGLDLYHIGLTVPDVSAAMEQYSATFGFTWARIHERTFEVIADFAIDGVAAGQSLAAKFQPKTQGVWELRLAQPLAALQHGKLIVSVRDRQGNLARIERTFTAK